MRANRRDRDQTVEDDLFLVYFDPFLDQQRAYVFTVNGYGVQGDAILRAGALGGGRFGVPRGDPSWNVLFETAAEIVGDGFVAEMAIPFKSLRYPQREAGAPHRWGLQIARIIGGRDEADVWSPTSRDIAGFLPQMGLLDGMTDLSRSHNLEILPTVTATRFGSLDRDTGRFREGDPSPEGGVNLKYGVTSNLTADVTFNPRLLADRIGPAADRDQPAVRAVLPRAAPLLPGGGRDLQHPGTNHRGPHPHHRGSGVRRQADRQGRADHPRRDVRQRRGAGERGRRHGPRLRAGRAHARGPGALRPLRRVSRRGRLHRPGTARRLQPARRRRLELPPRRHPRGRVPRHGDSPPGPRGQADGGPSARREVQQERPEPALRGVLVLAVARVQDRRGVRPPHRPALHIGDRGLSLVARALAPQLGPRVRLRAELRLRRGAAGRGRRRRHQPGAGPQHVRRRQRPAGAGAVRRHRFRQDPQPGLRPGGHQAGGSGCPSSTGAASRSASTRTRPTSAASTGSPRR